jgi:hypothetical protein
VGVFARLNSAAYSSPEEHQRLLFGGTTLAGSLPHPQHPCLERGQVRVDEIQRGLVRYLALSSNFVCAMEAICDPDNVAAALRAVVRNKGAPGIDGMTFDNCRAS